MTVTRPRQVNCLPKRAAAEFQARNHPTPWLTKTGSIRYDQPNLKELTPANENEGRYLYLIKLPTGGKVGVSKDPLKRITQHRTLARNYGIHIDMVWVSDHPTRDHRKIEKEVSAAEGRLTDEFIRSDFHTFLNPHMTKNVHEYVCGVAGKVYWSST